MLVLVLARVLAIHPGDHPKFEGRGNQEVPSRAHVGVSPLSSPGDPALAYRASRISFDILVTRQREPVPTGVVGKGGKGTGNVGKSYRKEPSL